ncbi:MAG: aminotransferase class III-fold pyridoxal phosphate-dependent enzyme, partial [Niameybacter sp.]
ASYLYKDTITKIEIVQGEGGVIALNKEFVDAVNQICADNDILLIADEVQTGVGRTGKFLASEHYNIKPDITTLAKGLGGGLPIGAVLLRDKVESVLTYSDHGTTYGGNPVVCAGAEVVVDCIDNELLSDVSNKAQYIKDKFSQCEEVLSVSGLGLMMGITLKNKTAKEVVEKAVQNYVLPLTAKEKVRLLPPLTITYDEIDKGLDILIKILSE